MGMILVPMSNRVDLAGGWATVWGTFSATYGSLTTLLTVVGVLLVIFALAKWWWERKRGGGRGSKEVMVTLGLAIILLAPQGIIPVVLKIIDLILNFLINMAAKF